MAWASKRLFLALAAIGSLLLVPAGAQAEISFFANFGGAGSAAGKLSNPAGVAVNNSNGNVYVVNRGNNRIEQFNANGAFVRTWGYDVVQTGAGNKPFANEVDEVRIRATGGSFALAFKGAETAQLPFNAAPSEVQVALNGLSTISAGGGSVTVSGGPGDEAGTNPYVVTFSGGPLAQTNLDLEIEPSGLGIPAGTELSCEGGPNSAYSAEEFAALPKFAYQWLANGTPIVGATSTTFTPGAGEAGNAIQCQVTGSIQGAATMATSRPYVLASPAPSSLPPVGPAVLDKPEGKAILESAGGVPLTCNAGTWTRSPTTFTYQWYRNGKAIGSSTTTAATSAQYTLTQADLATKGVFQCAVTANNAGGSSTTISRFLSTDPEQQEPKIRNPSAEVTVSASGKSKVSTRANGGAVFEVCKASPPGDTCKAGVAGSGVGQLSAPRSIAIDNTLAGAGAVYVMDDANPRVQKFSSEGAPLMIIGKGVNQTTDGNVCNVASGDACGGGIFDKRSNPGDDNSSPGAFGGVPTQTPGGPFQDLGNELAVDPSGNVYVGDPRRDDDYTQPRIQKFDSSGAFLAESRFPYIAANLGSTVQPISITADVAQRVYASTPPGLVGGGVERFFPSEFSATGDGATRAGNMFDVDGNPTQLALDPRNDRVLVSDRNSSATLSICGGPKTLAGHAIIEYDPQLHQIDCTVPAGGGNLPEVTGIAVSPFTTPARLYASVGSLNLIKIFKLPDSVAPQMGAQSVTKITTKTAQIHAQINPGFEDTTYEVEYGLEDCETGSCETAAGGTLYGLKFTDGATQINRLEPDTTYHYRVIAENGLGEVKGPDRTFTTFPLVDLVNDPCPNALARKQTKTAGLMDCRAYELVSAAFSGGYDVVSNLVSGQSPFDAHPGARSKVLYGVKDGGIPGSGKPTNRGIDPYVATRGDSGWGTKYVGIPSDNSFALEPFSSTLAGSDEGLGTFAFSGPEICDPCFADGSTNVPLRLPDGSLVKGMAGTLNPAADSAGGIAKPLSADGTHFLFSSTSKFEDEGLEGEATIYDRDLKAGTTQVVSTDDTGAVLTGDVGQLNVSADGSRVLVGEELGTDAKSSSLWHPYLHLGTSPNSVDLAEATTTGVYFNGMTSDGSAVYFTTKDKLLPAEDTDESADIYRADVDPSGNLDLSLVSVHSDGSPSNDDSCTPTGTPASWNAAEGDGKCGALAFAGGAGLASEAGLLYFLSPEKLDPAKGTLNQANLYLAEPGENPRFIATIDTSVGKPGQPDPVYPLVDSNFGDATYESVEALTVDQSNGDLYAIDSEAGSVHRYDSTGAPKSFSAGPHTDNTLTGFSFFSPSAAQVAVDNSGSALSGDIYVTNLIGGVKVHAPSGEALGALTGSGTNKGSFTAACGVAVDQAGVVYVADVGGFIWRYQPNGPTVPITDADYTVKGIATTGMQPCSLAADSTQVYASRISDGPVKRYAASGFSFGSPPSQAGTEITPAARALALDPTTNDLYVDQGDQVSVFDSAGEPLKTIGQGKLACGTLGSRGVAVDKTSHHVYASCFSPASIKEFGYEVPPHRPLDNPAIQNATDQSETHTYGDFQVTPDGSYAAFATKMPLKAGYDNAAHYELYRYEASSEALDCVSCIPTESQAESDSGLPPNGLGLLEDGRVFFNTGEQLTLSDTNGKLDAYEWKSGAQQLISTGNSAHSSGLLGVSSDGKDAFFFTREVLVPEDRNGLAMKIYDAREQGGVFVIPPPPPCAASDECHGPGTQAAPPPQVGTFRGVGGQAEEKPKKCPKGKVKRKGKCVKKPKHAKSKKGARR